MQDKLNTIQTLLAKDELDQAIEKFRQYIPIMESGLKEELILHEARLNKIQKDRRRGLLDWKAEEFERNQIRFALIDLLTKFQTTIIGGQTSPLGEKSEVKNVPDHNTLSVFISYSHRDETIAFQIKAKLQEAGITIRIDTDDLKPGENIEQFISSSVRDTHATICVVSRASLLSPWVAMEAVNTFYLQKWTQPKKFIACYLDDGFFTPEFRLDATKEIDARINQIDQLIPSYIEHSLDTVDLSNEKTRLFELRNNLGTVMQKLKESLSLDIRQPNFDQSIERIVLALRSANHSMMGN